MAKTKTEKRKAPLRENMIIRLVAMAKPIWKWLALACLLCLVVIVCSVTAPKILGELIDTLFAFEDGEIGGSLIKALIPGLGFLLVLYILHSLFSYLKMLLLNNVVSKYFTCEIRIMISDKIKRLPISYVDSTPVGDILSRMTDDVSTMGNYIHQIVDILMSGFLMIIAIAVMMVIENPPLALVVLALTPLSLVLSSFLASKSRKHFHAMFKEGGNLNAVVEESFTNFATTKAYNLEEHTEKKQKEVNDRCRKASATANFMSSLVQPVIAFTNAIEYIIICLLGGWLLVNGHIASVGTLVTILLFAKQISSPLEQIAGGFGSLEHASAAAARVFTILDMAEEENLSLNATAHTKGNVVFENVGFSYDKSVSLITDLNINVKAGQSVAIVGPTGAGKTTIVNLLMRFYDIDKGKIIIDGEDTASLSRESVREKFGMVLQDTWLFRGTIAENVAYGNPDATREEIISACDRAYCDHFIRTMPDGYDTVIGDDTTNLSGGQKQLLTIARAMLSNRPLLILDEATSNVDTRTEVLLQKAMDNLMKDRTSFVIAHRLSTIVDSDLILVIDGGRIAEQGTHDELLSKKGFYYKIYNSQYAI